MLVIVKSTLLKGQKTQSNIDQLLLHLKKKKELEIFRKNLLDVKLYKIKFVQVCRDFLREGFGKTGSQTNAHFTHTSFAVRMLTG